MLAFFLLLIGINIAVLEVDAVPSFNDPEFSKQFYLSEQYGVTMNIKKAWSKGFTGKGVTICIFDDTGVAKDHDEFAGKFVEQGSFDYNTNTSDPSPSHSNPLESGTMLAGIAAAKANNGKCGVGVAYDASLSGIKAAYPFGVLNDVRHALTLKHARNINDIYSCSWGNLGFFPVLDTRYMSEPVKNAMKSSTEEGRNGKGNIYIFEAGIEGFRNGTCGYNEYVTSIYTMGIGVVTGDNVRSKDGDTCSAITAVAYARDGSYANYKRYLMPAPGLRNTCSDRASSVSSAATAVASGIFALVLEANPNLGWRDVQHLVARSSCSQFPSAQWKTNKAGIRVSDDFGFGLLDADALTTNAVNWTNVGQQHECVIAYSTPEPMNGVNTLRKTVDFTTWPASCGGETRRINYLEHVVLQLSFNFTLRRNIEVEVTSPGGMKSIILRPSTRYDNEQEVKNLSAMSLHFWGENPRGNWVFTLKNVKPDKSQNGILYNWSFKLYGTASDPLAGNTIVESLIMAKRPNNTAAPPTTKPCGKKNSQPCGSVTIGASSIIATLFMSIAALICRAD